MERTTMTDQHTTGPWQAVVHGKLLFIAPVNRAPFGPKNIAGMVGKDADAQLMACAPELLAALEKAHGILDALGYVGPEHAAREALIRKARGVKPTEPKP